ncbi:PAS domain S-box protein [Pelobacter seleniigenes]|uniref:PAS domain S-box protein n=1 Tax=Pelobacter seleniigenes TaxID=407188 RepID=UPI0006918BD7|nr:PAS domain S-box protein [Pelobacter seleniigenes]
MWASDDQEIRHLFDEYLQLYASRDDRLTDYFSEDFSGFTGGGDFLVKDRAQWVAITRQDFAQVKEPLRIELKDLSVQWLAETIAVTTGFFKIHLPIEDHILSRETARLVLIFRKEARGWKISHSSISIPYHLVREGEVYPLQGLVERNKILEEQVTERTIQLSAANHELLQTNEKLEKEITNHKRAAEALRASKEQLSVLVDTSGAGIIQVSPREIIEFGNNRIAEMFGMSVLEFVGTPYQDHLHESEQIIGDNRMRQLIEGKIPSISLDQHYVRQDGTDFWGHLSCRRLENSDGSLRVLAGVITDITERKQTEDELRKSEERMRLFFEHQIVGMAIMSPEHGWLQVNNKLCQMLGYTREELKSKSWVDITYPEDIPLATEKFNSLLSGEIDNYSIEKRILRKDGEIVHTNLSIGCVRHPDGSVDYVLGLIEDVSAYQLLGLKREEDQRFLQTILDSISDFIFYKDQDSVFLGCNEAYASRYIGTSKDKIIGHSEKDFNPHSEAVEKFIESDRQVMETGQPSILKPWISLADGRKTLVEVLKTPFYDANKQVAGVIGVARDITKHHLALEAIIREKETAQRYLDIAGVMFCALNRAGEIILINKKGSEILGYGDNELLGQNWFDVCLPASARKKAGEVFAAQLAGEHTLVKLYESSIINRKGEERLIAFHRTFLHDEDGISGVLFSGEDITEKRLIQDELLKNQKLESLGVLAGGIAHDFNNILTAIIGNISLARRSLGNPEKTDRLLGNAEQASLRATSLATQLLTFAMGGKPIKQRVSVEHILEEALLLTLRGTNIKGILDIPEALHAIEADEGQLNQVFNNLLINAVQAMPAGGSLTVKAENVFLGSQNQMLLPRGEYVLLLFADQGCGIQENDLTKIFDPYFTTKSGGNGLGLASASSIIRRHGGHISATSTMGQGTIFQIYLPATDEIYSKDQAETEPQMAAANFSGSILVMDDETMILDILTDMLRHLGFHVTACENGALAVAKYKAEVTSGKPFSAVIMDLTIPGGMGGKEAAEQILAFDPKARLIVSSGYSNDLIMSDYGSYGFIGAVTKPYNLAKLSQVLSSTGVGNRDIGPEQSSSEV